jgi:hypothetical protein
MTPKFEVGDEVYIQISEGNPLALAVVDKVEKNEYYSGQYYGVVILHSFGGENGFQVGNTHYHTSSVLVLCEDKLGDLEDFL